MRTVAVAAALAATLCAAHARAEPAGDNVAQADALFAEAQKLVEAGDLDGACAKFDASWKLNSQAIGTLLNVARCDARRGKLAHAVALYHEARDRGREQNLPAYVAAADEQLAALTPLVPHVAITLAETLPGTTIVVDGVAMTPDASGYVGLDPGAHVITVSAPERVPFESHFDVAKSENKTIAVPALARPTTVTVVHRTDSSRRPLGILVTAGGGALAATGLVLGLVARSRYNDAIANDCPGGAQHCDSKGFAATQSARSLGNVGTILGAAGVVAAAVGAVVWLRAPTEHETRGVAVVPALAPGTAGIVAVGHF
jgi:tetratricopeptide (TPR) repeat protein